MFGRIDWDDRTLGAVFLLSSAVSVGLFGVPGTDIFTATLFDFGPPDRIVEISIAKAISLAALAATIVTNRTDFSKLTGVEMLVAGLTFAIVLVPPISPIVQYYLQVSWISGGLAIILQAWGFAVISYLG